MKMKEKGIPGDIDYMKNSANYPSGDYKTKFNAFAQMALDAKKQKSQDGKPAVASAKPQEIVRDIKIKFGDESIKVNKDGTVDPNDIKYPTGSVFIFSGAGDERVNFSDIKRALKDDFPVSPFVNIEPGQSVGQLGFSRTITDEEFEKIKSKVPQIGGQDVTYTRMEKEEERIFQTNRIQDMATRAVENAQNPSAGRGGRGGGRGARGGRGGGRGGGGRGGGRGGGGRGGGGQKRKADEPPTVESASKKVKVDAAGGAAVEAS